MTDEQWNAVKKDYVSQAHEAYAAVACCSKSTNVASPSSDCRRRRGHAGSRHPGPLGQAYNARANRTTPIAILDKVMAGADVLRRNQTVAQAERVRAIQARAEPNPPAPPPAADTKK